MSGKPFHDLTEAEATRIVNEIVKTACSKEEVRRRLNEAGFNGAAADITLYVVGPIFKAKVTVRGPNGETIRA